MRRRRDVEDNVDEVVVWREQAELMEVSDEERGVGESPGVVDGVYRDVLRPSQIG